MAKFKLEDGTEIEAFTAEELDSKVKAETGSLKSKIDELMDELKPAKTKAKALEEEKAEMEKRQLEEQGKFKELLEKEREENRKKTEAAEQFRTQVQSKDIEINLNSLVTQATKDTKRADTLKVLLKGHAKYGDDGVYYELDGAKIAPDALLSKFKESHDFLFDGVNSSGGGASGNNGGGAVTTNPWKRETRNLTEQARILRDNPAQAEKLKEEARK